MPNPNETLVDFEERDGIHVGTIRSPKVVSPRHVSEFGNRVLDYVHAHPGLNLLLSFENVNYLSSTALTELLRIHKAIEETNGHLRLCALSKVIYEAFEITNLDQMFVIYSEDVEESLKRFHRSLEVENEESAWDEAQP